MDEKLIETTSRAVDDDLGPDERAEFDRRVAEDAALADEVDSLRQLRAAVAELADRMEPPAELDAVIDPLRRSSPPPLRRVRPVYRWLGAAAAVVLGVTVAFEVARRNPQPTLEPRPRVVNHDEREIFPLAPLPSAVPGEDRPLGATDRLLEEEPGSPPDPTPAALEVVGPLTEDEHRASAGDATPAKDVAEADLETAPNTHRGRTESEKSLRSAARSAMPATGKQEAGFGGAPKVGLVAENEGRDAPAGPSSLGGRQDVEGVTPVALRIAGIERWTGRSTPCDRSQWGIRLKLQQGVVVGIETEAENEAAWAAGACRPIDLEGVSLSGLPDGIVIGEVVKK